MAQKKKRPARVRRARRRVLGTTPKKPGRKLAEALGLSNEDAKRFGYLSPSEQRLFVAFETHRLRSEASRRGWLTRRLKAEKKSRRAGRGKKSRFVYLSWKHANDENAMLTHYFSELRNPTLKQVEGWTAKVMDELHKIHPETVLWGSGLYYRRSVSDRHGKTYWEPDVVPKHHAYDAYGFESAKEAAISATVAFWDGTTIDPHEHSYQTRLIGVFARAKVKGRKRWHAQTLNFADAGT